MQESLHKEGSISRKDDEIDILSEAREEVGGDDDGEELPQSRKMSSTSRQNISR